MMTQRDQFNHTLNMMNSATAIQHNLQPYGIAPYTPLMGTGTHVIRDSEKYEQKSFFEEMERKRKEIMPDLTPKLITVERPTPSTFIPQPIEIVTSLRDTLIPKKKDWRGQTFERTPLF